VTSEKQIQANQRNAQKSTGPKTPEGKAAVRHNALRHGLLSRDAVVPGEDEAVFTGLGERLRDELQPVGELENMLVERIIAARWRLRRLGRVEAGIFAWEHYEELAERARRELPAHEKRILDGDIMMDGTTTMEDQQRRREDLSKAEEMKAKQDTEIATLGRAFIRDADGANAFPKLSRYEMSIERSLYKALHELRHCQADRRAKDIVAPPVAVDVGASGGSGEDL
jgi:hypothetical protein